MFLTGCNSTKHYVSYTVYPIGYLLNRIGGNKIVTTSIQTNTMAQLANVANNYKEILDGKINYDEMDYDDAFKLVICHEIELVFLS